MAIELIHLVPTTVEPGAVIVRTTARGERLDPEGIEGLIARLRTAQRLLQVGERELRRPASVDETLRDRDEGV